MKHQKKEQKHKYNKTTYIENAEPVWVGQKRPLNDTGSSSTSKRGTRAESSTRRLALQEALEREMMIRLENKIRKCLKEKKDLDLLKESCLNMKKIERGTVQDAEMNNGLKEGSITIFLRHSKKENITFWTDLVENSFDHTATIIKKELSTDVEREEMSSGSLPEPEKSKNQATEIDIRTCSKSLSKLMRDLPEDMKEWIEEVFSNAIVDASNYISLFSAIIFKLILLLQNNTYEFKDNNVALIKADGAGLNDVLPDYLKDSNSTCLPPPMKEECIASTKFNDELSKLFNASQLSIANSFYFGKKGALDSSLDENLLLKAFLEKISRSTEDQIIDTNLMRSMVSQYITNFTTMSNNPKRFNKVIDKLISTLLRVHLAPNKEKKKTDQQSENIQLREERKKKVKEADLKISNKSYNSIKRIFKKEDQCQLFYAKKVKDDPSKKETWENKIQKSQDRKEYFKKLLEKERALLKSDKGLLEKNAIKTPKAEEDDTDATADRLQDLKGTIKSLLFTADRMALTENEISTYDINLTKKEREVGLLIFNTIRPYMPPKGKRYAFTYQIPFLLMANQLFRATKCHQYKVNLCPIIKPTSLSSIRLDSASVYSLLASAAAGNKHLLLFDYDKNHISSKEKAIKQKDAVFGPIFSLQQLYDTCDQYSLNFEHSIVILPGLKTARLIGSKKRKSPILIHENDEGQESKSRLKSLEKKQSKEDKAAINEMRHEKTVLSIKLKQAKKARDEFLTKEEIKSSKKEWKMSQDRNDLHREINQLKKKRDRLIYAVHDIQVQVRECNTKMYFTRNGPPTATEKVRIAVDNKNYRCLLKAEKSKLNDTWEYDNLSIAGTDNGIVSISETTSISVKQFKFHLELYNNFSTLGENEHVEFDEHELKMAFVPKPFKMKSEEIKYLSGGYRDERSLSRRKRLVQDSAIKDIEKKLKSSSTSDAENGADLDIRMQAFTEASKHFRNFFYSKKSMKTRRTKELMLKRTKDRLCARERKHCDSHSKPLMFVGDRGYGFRSSIKGHLRYGGYWKQQIHSRYTSTFITNEHNSSQTCVFCFSKLSHPLKVTTRDSKKYVSEVRGTFCCLNKKCLLSKVDASNKGRDSVSALAIALAGATNVVLGCCLPPFQPAAENKEAGAFREKAAAFVSLV